MMNDSEADFLTAEQLAALPWVTAAAGSIAEMKELRERCLARGITAQLGCPGGKSCGPRTHLLVQPQDAAGVQALLAEDWQAQLQAEDLPPVVIKPSAPQYAHLEPCPACGTAAPTRAGACADCGLQLDF